MHGIDLEGVSVCCQACRAEEDGQDEFGCFHFMRFLWLVVSGWFLEFLPVVVLAQSPSLRRNVADPSQSINSERGKAAFVLGECRNFLSSPAFAFYFIVLVHSPRLTRSS